VWLREQKCGLLGSCVNMAAVGNTSASTRIAQSTSKPCLTAKPLAKQANLNRTSLKPTNSKTAVENKKPKATPVKRPGPAASRRQAASRNNAFADSTDSDSESESGSGSGSGSSQSRKAQSGYESDGEGPSSGSSDSSSDDETTSSDDSEADSESGSDGDDDGGEPSGPRKKARSDLSPSRANSSAQRLMKRGGNALLRQIAEHRSQDWALYACAVTRHPAFFLDVFWSPTSRCPNPNVEPGPNRAPPNLSPVSSTDQVRIPGYASVAAAGLRPVSAAGPPTSAAGSPTHAAGSMINDADSMTNAAGAATSAPGLSTNAANPLTGVPATGTGAAGPGMSAASPMSAHAVADVAAGLGCGLVAACGRRLPLRWAGMEFVSAGWAWLRQVGSRLPDATKSDVMLTTLTNFGSRPALEVLRALGYPAYLNGQFFVRYFWSGIYTDACTKALQSFVKLVAADDLAKAAYGARHVYLRLMSRAEGSEDVAVREIEDHHSSTLLRRIKSVEDVNDLLSLGWRPTVGALLEYAQGFAAQTELLADRVRKVAPAAWVDLSTTIPMWLDSPFDPATADAPSIDSYSDFWRATPQHWLSSEEQVRSQYPSMSLERHAKMHRGQAGKPSSPAALGEIMSPAGLQRMLALVHKSPTLIRYAWCAKSLTWLNYILLFRDRHFQTMLQVLLQPSAPRPPCLCPIERLTRINNTRRARRRGHFRVWRADDPRDNDISPRGHVETCIAEVFSNSILRPNQCMPWYRAAAPTAADPDRPHLLHAILPARKLGSPYSLSQLGTTVAIAHFLILLNAKGVTATSIQLLGDIVAHWPKQPTVKELRKILPPMYALSSSLAKLPPSVRAVGASTSPPAKHSETLQPRANAVRVFGALGSSGSVESHLLYRNPNEARLINALADLHHQLERATRDWCYPRPTQKLPNPDQQLLREIYDSVHHMIFSNPNPEPVSAK
jgi:hypothetical protein